ncbi:hypothetical protein B0H14DRAFT_2609474 [Mycena olivaceomarginata]|nr:hypothetical protein B0H14DRAFT_2609474 [Mycena olivaceomarginata]
MSSSTTSCKLDKPALTNEDKHCKHAEAQHKYREKYFASALNWRELIVCQKPRSNMREGPQEDGLREGAKPLKRRLERKQRQSRDAEKFLAEFSWLLGVDELPGILRQDRKDMVNAPEAHKEKDGEEKKEKKKNTKKEFLGLQLQKFEAMREKSSIGGFCPDSAQTAQTKHNGNARKSWFLVLHAGLFTKCLGQCGAHLGQARVACLGQARGAPLGQARDARERRGGEAKTLLFQEDSEVSPLSCACKRPSPASSPSSRKLRTSASAHSVSPRAPGPNTSPSLHWDECGLDLLGVEPVGIRGFELAVTHLHAGGSPSTGTQSRRHAEPPVLFNKISKLMPFIWDLKCNGCARDGERGGCPGPRG